MDREIWLKSENNEEGKCEKAPDQDVETRKTCDDSAPSFVVCMHSLKTTYQSRKKYGGEKKSFCTFFKNSSLSKILVCSHYS